MRIAVITPPAQEPLTVEEARSFALVTTPGIEIDDVLQMLISRARADAEHELGRYLVTQTLEMYLDSFPYDDDGDCDEATTILLPPIQSLVSIKYVDVNAAVQTLDPALYAVDAISKPARVMPSYGNIWPITYPQRPNAVTVRFIAGYGAAAVVPATIKHWMALRVRTFYDNRDAAVLGDSRTVPMPSSYADGMLDPERVQGWQCM